MLRITVNDDLFGRYAVWGWCGLACNNDLKNILSSINPLKFDSFN